MCEPGLISILFLSHNKHKLADISLTSTRIAAGTYADEVEWCLLEQGNTLDAEDNIRMFRDLKLERKVIILPDTNYGINNALNSLWHISRGEYIMIHESDWLNKNMKFNFLQIAKDIFDERPNVGIVQLRSIWDYNEQWGRGKPEYWPWDLPDDKLANHEIRIWHEKTKNGHEFLISEFPNGFNNNPNLMRKSLYRECGPYPEPPLNCDLRHGETEYQQRVAKTGCAIAHILTDVYHHIGGALRFKYETL